MAWTHFPVLRGDRLTAAMLNELRAACAERGITGMSELSAGQSAKTAVGTALAAMRSGIEAAAANFYHIESYTSESTYTLHRFTTGAGGSLPGYTSTNIFTHVFGAGVTTWPHAGLSPVSADELNDIYEVLNAMTAKVLPPKAGSNWSTSESRTGSSQTTVALALSSCNGASYSSSFTANMHAVTVSQIVLNYIAAQDRRATGDVYEMPSLGTKMWFLHTGSSSGLSATTIRDLTAYARIDESSTSMPSSWSNANTWGSVLSTLLFPSGTTTGTSLHRLASSEADECAVVQIGPAVGATGALTGVGTENVGVSTALAFAEMDYDKA